MGATMFCLRKNNSEPEICHFLLFYMSNVVLLSLNTHKLINFNPLFFKVSKTLSTPVIG